MGRVVCFSEFDNYFHDLTTRGISVEGTILDANIIITMSYEPKKFHTRINDFIRKKILTRDIALFTTVNTSQEYLEFYRRLLLTEGLRTAISPESTIKLPNNKRSVIRLHSGSLENREKTQGADPVFSDGDIKKIRRTFCSTAQGINLWKFLCEKYLKKQLLNEYKELKKLNINYLSTYKDDVKEHFKRKITWEEAIELCTDMGIGFSDAMILNALESTDLPFAITMDTDMAYAIMGNPNLKDIIMPDDIVDKL
jgi:hypothetical protein